MINVIELETEFYNNFGLPPFKLNNISFVFMYLNETDNFNCKIVDNTNLKEIMFTLTIDDILDFYDNTFSTLNNCTIMNNNHFSIKVVDDELYFISIFNGTIKVDKNTANKIANLFNSIIINYPVIKDPSNVLYLVEVPNKGYFYISNEDSATLHYVYIEFED